MMRKLAIGISVLVLSVYGGASASISAVSNDALDDQADGARHGTCGNVDLDKSRRHGGAGHRHSACAGGTRTRADA